ncbi:MAG TPA: ribosome silencing factor [Acidimicrobiales bacterium]|nr:ribosome silencing factor [Acidimicrobiales bacterium]
MSETTSPAPEAGPRAAATTAESSAPDTADLVAAAAAAAADLLATDIVVIDVGDVLAVTDHFVIASGSNVRQVKRIAEEIRTGVKDAGGSAPVRTEGLGEGNWVLLDYGPFVVHVFHERTRQFYDLDGLWSDMDRRVWDPATEELRAG